MRHRTTILALVLLVMVSLFILPLALSSLCWAFYAMSAAPACLLLTLLFILAFIILLVLPRLIARR